MKAFVLHKTTYVIIGKILKVEETLWLNGNKAGCFHLVSSFVEKHFELRR